jgi:hypothetical protein
LKHQSKKEEQLLEEDINEYQEHLASEALKENKYAIK